MTQTIDHAQATYFALEQMTKYLQEIQALHEEVGTSDMNRGALWFNSCKRAIKKSSIAFGTSDVEKLISELRKITSGDCARWVGDALINRIQDFCSQGVLQ